MEVLEVLLLVLAATTGGPLVASFVAQESLRSRIRRSERIVSSLQQLGVSPTGGVLAGTPPVLVYRDPDDVVVVAAQLSWALTLVRSPLSPPLGCRVLGDADRVTLEAIRAAGPLGATVYDGEIRIRVADGGDLVHPIDAVRELHELLERPSTDAVDETARAAAHHPTQLGASLRQLGRTDPDRAERVARDLWRTAPPRSRIELAIALRDPARLVELALSAVATADHAVAWEAARRLCLVGGDADPALAAADVLVPHDLTASGLLRGLRERPTAARAAWLAAAVDEGLTAWAPSQRGAAVVAALAADPDEVRAIAATTCPWPEGRAAAVDALGACGTVRAVPALRARQLAEPLLGPRIARAVAAIQERAGGVPGALTLAGAQDGRGVLALAAPPGGHVDLAAQAGATIDTPRA